MGDESGIAPETRERPKSSGCQARLTTSSARRPSPSRLFVKAIIPIFVAEFAMMVALAHLQAVRPSAHALIDASALVILASPSPYFFLFRPLVLHMDRLRQTEADLRVQVSAINAASDQVIITDTQGRIRFPVNTVKIDRSFIWNIHTNPDDAAIADAVVAMAHSLKLKVIA